MLWLIGVVGLVVVAVVGWRVSRWVVREKALSGVRVAERARERAAVLAVPTPEAFTLIEARVRLASLSEPWRGDIPDDIQAVLATLHPDIASFLRRHRIVRLEENLEIGAECLRERGRRPEGAVPIGRDLDDADWALCTRVGDPEVFESSEHETLGTYPTLAHFLLLMTED